MSNKLFVGNLSFETTENDLQDAFAAHGTVTETNLMMDRITGRPRGFGFITMSTPEEAQKAIAALNGSQLGGRALTVNVAKPREERAPGGGGRREYGGSRQSQPLLIAFEISRRGSGEPGPAFLFGSVPFAGWSDAAVASRSGKLNQFMKEEHIEVEGRVTTVLPGTMFRVELDNKHLVLATICGKMRKRWVRLTVGDRVKMDMSPYDLNKARITWRLR